MHRCNDDVNSECTRRASVFKFYSLQQSVSFDFKVVVLFVVPCQSSLQFLIKSELLLLLLLLLKTELKPVKRYGTRTKDTVCYAGSQHHHARLATPEMFPSSSYSLSAFSRTIDLPLALFFPYTPLRLSLSFFFFFFFFLRLSGD